MCLFFHWPQLPSPSLAKGALKCPAEPGTWASLRLPDHELAWLFFLLFSCCPETKTSCLIQKLLWLVLSCCHQPAFFNIWLTSYSIYLSPFTVGCHSLPPESSAAGGARGKPPHPTQEEYTGPYLQPDISTISWMVQEYIVPSLLKREFILLTSVRLSTLQPLLLLVLLFLFSFLYIQMFHMF